VTFELIGVPYTSMAKPGGIANAIHVLREAGLGERFAAVGDVRDAGDLQLVEGNGVRGASGLLNELALGRLVEATGKAVRGSLEGGRRPILVGGDCPVLLGALAAGRDRFGETGLLHVDRLAPLLAPEAVAMLGPRDRREIEEGGAASLEGSVALFRDDEAIRASAAETSASEAIASLTGRSPTFWLHIDLDALRTDEFPAADYTQPGGLTWPELLAIARRTLAEPGCFGCSVVIYNPDLDPERTSAARIVRFVSDLVAG
jgi:arginase